MSISNDFLINGEYDLSSRKGKRALFLDSCVLFVKSFYFDACTLFNANAFVMYMKCFLHFLKKFWNDKYPHIDFDFYLSRRAQNVHMRLSYSRLTLHEYKRIISDMEEL